MALNEIASATLILKVHLQNLQNTDNIKNQSNTEGLLQDGNDIQFTITTNRQMHTDVSIWYGVLLIDVL